MQVLLQGGGIASRCCAGLLARIGIPVFSRDLHATDGPAVMLGEAAIRLLGDCLGRPFEPMGGMRISRRIVAWGGREPASVPHSGVTFGAGELSRQLPPVQSIKEPLAGEVFSVRSDSTGTNTPLKYFGRRSGSAASVRLLRADENDACWIEALDRGWLFLIPTSHGRGWLLGVGDELSELIGRSRYISRRVEIVSKKEEIFETAPRILSQLSGPGWLACGANAIAFDPLCGDGAGQAAREAILGAAVIQAVAERRQLKHEQTAVLLHYHSMLLASMRRHLRICAQFYDTGGRGEWWREQVETLALGFEWCTERLTELSEPQYELHGLRLYPRARAA
ncbi:hypothetical protein HK28_13395 [Acetobacter sp. DsW_063]|nr:hypothetical protein HK28_13395 [Acetobacter sp. DsW_063]